MDMNLIDSSAPAPRTLGFTPGHFALIGLCLVLLVAFAFVTHSAASPRFTQETLPASSLSYDQIYQQASSGIGAQDSGQVAGSIIILPRGPAAQ